MTLLATFRAKVQEMQYGDKVRQYVQVPELNRRHVDMHKARMHPQFGSYANSDLFPAMLRRCAPVKQGALIYLDDIPAGVNVDTSGFLAAVTLEIERK